jgi:hypothetical protein
MNLGMQKREQFRLIPVVVKGNDAERADLCTGGGVGRGGRGQVAR